MVIPVILFFVGLALVVAGADDLVDGASGIARRAGLSEFVIGLTIVGMGTSAPEMVVSLLGALEGKGDVAVGNVVGSNIFNTLLILGLTAVLLPIGITSGNRRRDIPMNLLVTVLFIILGLEATLLGLGTDGLSRLDGAVLLLLFAGYMWISFAKGKDSPDEEASGKRGLPLWRNIFKVIVGLAALAIGGKLFVDNATLIASRLGISDKFIAITILAGGTSLPELATCVAAAAKKKGQLALGNIIGSNIFNMLLILGVSSVIKPLSYQNINLVDMGMLLLSALLLLPAAVFPGKSKLGVADGAVFLLVFAAYMAYLIINL
ncbi:MAG: calcium/sodium antiporter [Bacteroidales bacterium]|nr:calcium/sodium antiporter [Bacteroidales bacterium]